MELLKTELQRKLLKLQEYRSQLTDTNNTSFDLTEIHQVATKIFELEIVLSVMPK